jgi:tetratricopeptide (TPR) repeat protein
MIGYKIRELRQALGLSQQQLAGKEMTRAFISLVESGKCTPSHKTLRIIAQRLGKSVDYFLADEGKDETLELAITLLESAVRELDQPSGAESGSVRVLRQLQQALRQIASLERVDLEAQARSLSVRCLLEQDRLEEALEESERALECYKQIGDAKGIAQVYRNMGTAAYRLQRFQKAHRAFERALLYSDGLKSRLEFRTEILTNLGSTLFRLGQYPEAIAHYQEALKECEVLGDLVACARITMGLGWTSFQVGDLVKAQRWTVRAVDLFKAAKSPDFVLARQNLAIIEAAKQNWERAYLLLQECLQLYQEQGRIEKQASIHEELARYWLHKGDLQRAEATCWEALELLEVEDNRLLRGRLYRFLGNLLAGQGNLKQAKAMLRVSYEILKLLNMPAEISVSLQALAAIKRLESSGENGTSTAHESAGGAPCRADASRT